jgi:hypothetical protein
MRVFPSGGVKTIVAPWLLERRLRDKSKKPRLSRPARLAIDDIRHWLIVGHVVFVETPIFTRRVADCLDDDEYAALQGFLAERPEAGKNMPGTGGIRKLRWAGSGRGKRGGLRVIYFWWMSRDRISMLMIYPKSERDDLTAGQLKQLRGHLTL